MCVAPGPTLIILLIIKSTKGGAHAGLAGLMRLIK
jgi:hypothetical protein